MIQQAFEFALPKSLWLPPASLPNIHDKLISLDTETLDPQLKEKGPSFLRDCGRVVGISLAWSGGQLYLPVGHTFGGNLDKGTVVRWLKEEVLHTSREVVLANAQYDLGWLRTIGIEVPGKVHDIQIMDPLLDSERDDGYSLNALCKRWLGETKDESILIDAAKIHGFDDPKAVMDRLDPRFVGPYAEADARQTLAIYHKIREHPEWREVEKLYDEVEQPLIKVLFGMMSRGVRVDTLYAEKLNDRWKKEEEAVYLRLGFRDVWDGKRCARFLRESGVQVGTSVDKAFLESLDLPGARDIRVARELNRCRETFLEQNIVKGNRKGRIHPQYVQLASDEGGTRSGRLACKNPNAQQFPKRSVNIDSKAIRKCFIPEDGELWAKLDYWSQEPVIQCHYGICLGLDKAQEVGNMMARGTKLYKFIEENSNGRLSYDDSKEVVLARSYGQRTKGLAAKMGLSLDEAERLQEDFDKVVPYIAELAQRCSDRAGAHGYVRTLLGRKQRFNLWQPVWNDNPDERHLAMTLEKAKARWGSNVKLKRAGLYKALNWLVQGSAADQTKLAIVQVSRDIGIPTMTVHDETNKSVKNKEEALHMKHIMETCVKLRLPVRADLDLGTTWQ